MKDPWFYLLSISTVSHRLVIIIFKNNVTELTVWNVFNYVPLHGKLPTPLILLPEVHTLVKIHRSNHFSYPTELSTSIYLEIDEAKNFDGSYLMLKKH